MQKEIIKLERSLFPQDFQVSWDSVGVTLFVGTPFVRMTCDVLSTYPSEVIIVLTERGSHNVSDPSKVPFSAQIFCLLFVSFLTGMCRFKHEWVPLKIRQNTYILRFSGCFDFGRKCKRLT